MKLKFKSMFAFDKRRQLMMPLLWSSNRRVIYKLRIIFLRESHMKI